MAFGTSERAEAVISLVGRDDISGLIQNVGDRVDGLADRTSRSAAAVTAVKESWASVATGLNSVLDIAGKVGGAIGTIAELIEGAAQRQGIEAAFRRAIPAADLLAERIEAATGGQLTEQAYQKLAITAAAAGLAGDEVTQALHLSTQAANALGQDVTAAGESMIKTLIEGTDEAFKQVGLIVKLDEVYADTAKQLGVTVESLDAATKRTAVLEAAARAAADTYGDVDVDDSAIAKVNYLKAAWDGVKNSVGDAALAFAQGPWAKANDTLNLFEKLAKSKAYIVDKTAAERAAESAQEATEAEIKLAQTRIEAAAKHRQSLVDELDASKNASMAAAQHAMELQNVANQQGRTADAAKYEAEVDRHLAEAKGQKLVPSIKDTFWALKTQQIEAMNAANAMAIYALSIGRVHEATQSFAEAKRLADLIAGKPLPRSGGGQRNPGFNNDAESKRQIAAQNQAIIDKDKTAQLQRDIDFIIREGEQTLAAQQAVWAKEETERKAHETAQQAATQSLGDMIAQSTLTGFQAANQALASGSEQYAQGLAQFASTLHSEFGRINDIMEQTEKLGGTTGQAFQKAAPGMITAIGGIGAAFAKDAKVKYAILAAGEGAAALASFGFGDIKGGVLHAAAAVQYGIAAGLAGGSASAGGGASAGSGGTGAGKGSSIPGGFGPSAQPTQAAPEIHLHFGTVIGNKEDAAHEMAGLIDKHVNKFRSSSDPRAQV